MLHKYDRTKFCNILDTYWSRFANNWDVLLHGSPAVDIYNGMKLAAGGELGMGVGEEEWGSGERLVLEDFVQKTDGLVDLVVSRFGEPLPSQMARRPFDSKDPVDVLDSEPWIGSGSAPDAVDGVVFSGVGAVARHSLRDLSHWIESIYAYGDYAYGVRDNPTANRRRRRRKNPKSPPPEEPIIPMPRISREPEVSPHTRKPPSSLPPNIPRPIVRAVEASLKSASTAVDASQGANTSNSEPFFVSLGDTETWVKYLTLGYGSSWGGRKAEPDEQAASHESTIGSDSPEGAMRYVEPQPDIDHAAERLKAQVKQENSGYFVIGLKGDMEDEDVDDSNDEGEWNNRTLLRTIHLEMTDEVIPETPGTGEDESPIYERELTMMPDSISKLRRLRPVVYVVRNSKPLAKLY